jgi:hypothetical protein
VLGKAAGLLLGEDELPVAENVELPFAAREVLRGDPIPFQLGHETRGPLVVARSGRAVVDLDSHGREPTALFVRGMLADRVGRPVSALPIFRRPRDHRLRPAGARGLFDLPWPVAFRDSGPRSHLRHRGRAAVEAASPEAVAEAGEAAAGAFG